MFLFVFFCILGKVNGRDVGCSLIQWHLIAITLTSSVLAATNGTGCVLAEGHSQGEYFRCPPPIISIFGYVIEDRKIRNTCFFIFPPFSDLRGENSVQS